MKGGYTHVLRVAILIIKTQLFQVLVGGNGRFMPTADQELPNWARSRISRGSLQGSDASTHPCATAPAPPLRRGRGRVREPKTRGPGILQILVFSILHILVRGDGCDDRDCDCESWGVLQYASASSTRPPTLSRSSLTGGKMRCWQSRTLLSLSLSVVRIFCSTLLYR